MEPSSDVRGYLELRIELRSQGKDEYDVQMRFGDEVRIPEKFRFSESALRVDQTLAGIWTVSDQRPVRKGLMDEDPVVELGTKLYAAILRGPREAFFRRCQESAAKARKGLRLQLVISDAGAAAVPWELLHDGRDFLSLSTYSPMIRTLERAQDQLAGAQGNVRILAATADLESSQGRWKQMTRDLYNRLSNEVSPPEVEFLEDATLARLEKCLCAGAYDIVHLCGHAEEVLPNTQALLLLDERGRPAPVPPEQLVEILKLTKDLKLVCLDACNSDLLAFNLARAMPVPAVYGIQSMISDESAFEFAHGFLAALLSGQTLTTAAIQGRQAIDRARPGSREWGLPVVYTASPDSQLTLGAWQTMSGVGSREVSKGIAPGTETAAVSDPAGSPSPERQKLEIWLTLKRKNLESLESQLAASSYPTAGVQAQAAELREEIAALESQLDKIA
jgi:hypothetical protein